MRSNWTDATGKLDTTATYVSFNAGDRLAYHQFYDQGNFTIFHNGDDLVVRSGVYSGDGTSDHDANYYVRTIAANTILVCDLAENFDGIRPNGERDVWLNDCGQRTHESGQPHGDQRRLPVGELARLRYRLDHAFCRSRATSPICAPDITGAYNSTVYTTPENRAKVRQRDPRVGLLAARHGDRFGPGGADLPVATRRWTSFTSRTSQSPSGLFFGSLVRDSAIYMQNLKPNSRVTMVPGFEVAGQMVDQSWGEPVSNDFERDPYGFFRLEITSGAARLGITGS